MEALTRPALALTAATAVAFSSAMTAAPSALVAAPAVVPTSSAVAAQNVMLAGFIAERLNRTMALLSIVASVFLPLTFITGLLGINVSGIPFADSDWAFAIVVGGLVVVGVFEVLLFRRFRLL